MPRMMVYLNGEDHENLRRLAFEARTSLAEQIRRAVKQYIASGSKARRERTRRPKQRAKG